MNLKLTWTELKAIASAKSAAIQHAENAILYVIVLLDGSFVLYTNIAKTSPRNADQIDFEDNYKASSNQRIINTVKTRIQDKDGIGIGSVGDRLKVENTPSTTTSTVPGILKLAYDDMNVANGGVARGSSISTSYVTIYNRSGSGVIFGFCVTFEGNLLGADEFILKFTVDSLVVAEISSSDIGTNALYSFGDEGDALYFGWQLTSNSIVFKAPGQGGVRYNASVKVEIKKVGGSSKRFRAGLIGLTKE